MDKSRWGILAVDSFRARVIPSLLASTSCEVASVSSCAESISELDSLADRTPVACDVWEQLLEDPSIGIVYLSLPVVLHSTWIRKALEAGKHVLCEAPLALDVEEIERLIELRDKCGLLVGEANAVFHQRRFSSLRGHLADRSLGALRGICGSYYRDLREDAQKMAMSGGGALSELGHQLVSSALWLFGEEPVEVACVMDREKPEGIDIHTSALLRYPCGGQLCFTCGVRHPEHSAMTLVTDSRRIGIPRPFTSDTLSQTVFEVFAGTRFPSVKTYSFEPSDPIMSQCESFADATRGISRFPGSLELALAHAKVLSALYRAADSRAFERV